MTRTLLGTLLAAASLAFPEQDPRGGAAYLLQFSLTETPAAVVARMGAPRFTADFEPGFRTLQFQIDTHDNHEFSHAFCFDKNGRLLSITRNSEEPELIDALFPPGATRTYQWPAEGKAQYRVRVRSFPDGRFLLAMGVGQAGEKTTQLVLARRAALEAFFPWLAEQTPEPRTP